MSYISGKYPEDTVADIACAATCTGSVADAIKSLDRTDSWGYLIEFLNDPRVFQGEELSITEVREDLMSVAESE